MYDIRDEAAFGMIDIISKQIDASIAILLLTDL